jgi:hypothetical protein
MNKPGRLAQFGANVNWGWPRGKMESTQGNFFHMTQKKARVVTNVVASALLLYSQLVCSLIDHRATYSFVARKFENKLSV